MKMKRMLQHLTGLTAFGFLALASAWGQANYATPYAFTTIAGTAGNSGSADGTNGNAQFGWPEGMVLDHNGALYVVDTFENNIRKVVPAGTNWVATTIAGSGAGISGVTDGTNQDALFNQPTGIAIDRLGNLFVVDSQNYTIREITPVGTNWVVTTIAGAAGGFGFADGTNEAAQFESPYGVAVDASGNLYVTDSGNYAIRQLTPVGTNWVARTIIGGGYGNADGTNLNAQFAQPSGIALDGAGSLYVTDTSNHTIRKAAPAGTNWIVTTIAGTPSLNGGSADGTNGRAQFHFPYGIAVDAGGNLYVADSQNNTIRKVAPVGTNWVTTTLAGVADGSSGGSSDGTGAGALFSYPYGVAVDAAGNLFVGDTLNGTIREGWLPGVPSLTIALAALNSGVVVSWPGAGGFTLQTNADLARPTGPAMAAMSRPPAAPTAPPSRRPRQICFSD